MTTPTNKESVREAIQKILVRNYLPEKSAKKKLWGEYVAVVLELEALVDKAVITARKDELSKVWSGMNTAGGIRDGGYSARNLNLDDLAYWLFNRRRVLDGRKALTPEKWLEAER